MFSNNHFLKFLFLGVVLISVLVGNQNLKSNNKANILDVKISNNAQNLLEQNVKSNLNVLNAQNYKNNIKNDLIIQSNEQVLNDKVKKDNNLNNFVFERNISEINFPEVSAKIVLVADIATGQILWSKNINQRWPIASLTKLITSVFALINFDQNTKITLTEKDINVLDSGTQSNQNLQAGESYSVSDLIKWMMLASRNEAAEGLANFFGREKFIEGMNKLVKDWQINSTYFNDPTGLSVSNQSVPEDILKIIQKIYFEYPDILKISTKKTLQVKDLTSLKNKTIYNIHPFAGYHDFLGGKTGFINESKQNLISVFNFKKRPVMILVMGSESRAEDTQIIYDWLRSNFDLIQK